MHQSGDIVKERKKEVQRCSKMHSGERYAHGWTSRNSGGRNVETALRVERSFNGRREWLTAKKVGQSFLSCLFSLLRHNPSQSGRGMMEGSGPPLWLRRPSLPPSEATQNGPKNCPKMPKEHRNCIGNHRRTKRATKPSIQSKSLTNQTYTYTAHTRHKRVNRN